MIDIQFQIFYGDHDELACWRCDMPFVPRIGDELCVPEDELPDDIVEAFARITDVTWHVDPPRVHICADATEVAEREPLSRTE